MMTLNTFNIMRKWIYLKSYNPADALALATVLASTSDNFYIVRQSFCTFIFKNLANVTIDYYTNGEELIVINQIESKYWLEKCIYISETIGIASQDEYIPYEGFIEHSPYLDSILQQEYALLYLFPNPYWNIDLILIDKVTKNFNQQKVDFISGGSIILPCINGTKDLREIINISKIAKFRKNIRFILTTEDYITTIGEAFGIKVFIISEDNGIRLNGYPIYDANQIVNFILSNL